MGENADARHLAAASESFGVRLNAVDGVFLGFRRVSCVCGVFNCMDRCITDYLLYLELFVFGTIIFIFETVIFVFGTIIFVFETICIWNYLYLELLYLYLELLYLYLELLYLYLELFVFEINRIGNNLH